jgi:hypothetical protein
MYLIESNLKPFIQELIFRKVVPPKICGFNYNQIPLALKKKFFGFKYLLLIQIFQN